MRTEYEKLTYKLIFQEPKLNQDGGCDSHMCPCYGPFVIDHSRSPLLFDVDADPEEKEPIDDASDIYKLITSLMLKEKDAFKSEIDRTKMPSQFNSYNILPRPWLQPYLNV